MRRAWSIGRWLLLVAALLAPAGEAGAHDFDVLVFSKTAGSRHESIPAGIAAIQQLGIDHDFGVVATEDASLLNPSNLAQFEVLVLLQTTGDFLDAAQQGALQAFVQSGGGVVGIHAAADAEYAWPWYGEMIGAWFDDHPAVQQGTVLVLDHHHPSTSTLPERWVRTDEWFNFQGNPRGNVHVLATVDEATYTGGTMGHDHPIAWCHEFDGGRVWYTGLGHAASAFEDATFLLHLLGGIEWAAGAVAADAGATIHARMEKVVLDANVINPMALQVADDGRVVFIERGGSVKIFEPTAGLTVTAAQIAVYTGQEDGLLGVALDPQFLTNGWIYLYYSPAGPTAENVLSRFTIDGDAIVTGSERVLLRVPTQRDECCHSGGGMEFGRDGNLFLTIGDDTNPFDADGYAPIDERAGRSAWDAQRSAANTNDLRGKILRIRPEPDGTYSIPPGNLFPVGTPSTRPEIYVMGARNPFRTAVDPFTGYLYWGDVGPDANADLATRGSKGFEEINQTRVAGNYGWPYFVADNRPYRDYNFATGASGALFNSASPTNESPNNTGLTSLPPAKGAFIWYSAGTSAAFPALSGGSGRAIMLGAFYRHVSGLASDIAFPAYFDRTLFAMEWSRNLVYEIKTDADGAPLKITEFAPTLGIQRAMDLTFGPDGAMYVLEWGNGFAGNNADAQLVRIGYNAGNKTPVVVASADPASGAVPLTVQFVAAASYDPDPGDTISFAWDFDLDGTIDSTMANPSHTYTLAGNFTAQVRVSDQRGKSGVASIAISAGNSAPVVTFTWPPDGGFFDWGDAIDWSLRVDDPEDGSTATEEISPSAVQVDVLLGHASHGHGIVQTNGVSGTAVAANSHAFGDDLFFAFEAAYTDTGAPGVVPATGIGTIVLQPKTRQAEHFTAASGVITAATNDPAGGGFEVQSFDHGDHFSFFPINLLNISEVGFRYAASAAGGRVEVRADAPDGPLLATVNLPSTGGFTTYRDAAAPIVDPGGTRELFVVAGRNPGDVDVLRLNWISFRGPGVTATARGPRVTSARAMPGSGSMIVAFDDVMDAASLEVPGRYTLAGVTVAAAVAAADLRSVVLSTSPLTAGQAYVLAIEGVRDLAGDPIAPGTRIPFRPLVAVQGINMGGGAFTAADGTTYLADQFYTGGNAYWDYRPVAGTSDDLLFQTERFGAFSYAIPLTDGSYFVTLRFAEIFFSQPGKRVFNLTLEGIPVVSSIDLFARVGAFHAYDVTVPVTVADGVLDVAVAAIVENPKLSALLITRAPPPFTDFPSWQMFYFNSTNAPGTAAFEDWDEDGLSNVLECALGGDPTVHDASHVAPRFSLRDGVPPRLTLSYRKASPALVYRVVSSTTLAPASWSEVGVEPEVYFAPTGEFQRSTPLLPGEAQKFLRLEVDY